MVRGKERGGDEPNILDLTIDHLLASLSVVEL